MSKEVIFGSNILSKSYENSLKLMIMWKPKLCLDKWLKWSKIWKIITKLRSRNYILITINFDDWNSSKYSVKSWIIGTKSWELFDRLISPKKINMNIYYLLYKLCILYYQAQPQA